MWGFNDNNTLGTTPARTAEIYQWNLGIQHLFPGGITIGADYSGSQSRHLPFSSGSRTGNENFLPSALRNRIVANYNTCLATDPNPNADCTSPTNVLASDVNNPFKPLFNGPNAMFNEPSSLYNNDQIPLINLLRPFPQFDGQFSALTLLGASASYNSLQVRFQKRASHYVSFEGNYTWSKAIDDSSAGQIPSSLMLLLQAGGRKNQITSGRSAPSAQTTRLNAWFWRLLWEFRSAAVCGLATI
jgi:hypothetical protein